jgi:hypothetical protein
MCLSCGCNIVYDNHDNYGNITMQNIMDAAKAGGVDPDDVINNIENTYARFVDHDFEDIDNVDSDDDNGDDS